MDWRTGAEESANEQKRREENSQREFTNGPQNPRAARHLRIGERPQFIVPLRGEVRVVELMRRAVKAEAHQAQRADDRAVDFVQEPAPPQQPVSRFVTADQHRVHDMDAKEESRTASQ
jgi:hypothetical protein